MKEILFICAMIGCFFIGYQASKHTKEIPKCVITNPVIHVSTIADAVNIAEKSQIEIWDEGREPFSERLAKSKKKVDE
jgi:hypothetical protein